MRKRRRRGRLAGLALRVGVAGAIGFAAVATGLLLSRKGRRLVREAWQGRQRTRLEDRVLDALWGDPVLGGRSIDVEELESGTVALSGRVESEDERRRAVTLAGRTQGVSTVVDRLEVAPGAGGGPARKA